MGALRAERRHQDARRQAWAAAVYRTWWHYGRDTIEESADAADRRARRNRDHMGHCSCMGCSRYGGLVNEADEREARGNARLDRVDLLEWLVDGTVGLCQGL